MVLSDEATHVPIVADDIGEEAAATGKEESEAEETHQTASQHKMKRWKGEFQEKTNHYNQDGHIFVELGPHCVICI